MNNKFELEISVLASILWSPRLAATAFHRIPLDLWKSGHLFADTSLRVVADAIADCWENQRDATPANVFGAARMNGVRNIEEIVSGITSRHHGESDATLEKAAADLAAIGRKERLTGLVSKAEALLKSDDQEPEALISQAVELVNSNVGTGLEISTAEDCVRRMAELYALREAGKGRAFGIPTGFHYIDTVVGGLPTGNVSIIGARPSQGKTAIASCIALHAAKQGFPVIFFSHEMTADDIMARMVCQYAGLSFKHVRKAALSQKGKAKMSAAFGFVQKLPLYIIDAGGALPSECRTTAMYIINKHKSKKPPLIVVDYVQLEHMRRGVKEEFRLQELQQISQYWCETAKITNAAVLLLSQLNRDASGTQPTMNQLAQCGALEQDANVIMLLWRPAKDRKEEDANMTPEPSNRRKAGYNWGLLSVPKSRNSDLTEQELYFSGYDMKFRDWNAQTDRHLTKHEMAELEKTAMTDDVVKLNNQTLPMPSRPLNTIDESDVPDSF